jgi:beta-N-acetylhexosaminidase
VPPNVSKAANHAASGLAPGERQRERIDATVSSDLAHMSLDEKLGQVFLIETVWQDYSGDLDAMVRQMHAGAMIVYAQNLANPAQLRRYLGAVQAHAAIPLMISTDEEGGGVDRLGNSGFAPAFPSAENLATESPQAIRQTGATEAQVMRSFGFNTDLAPVVDVRTNPAAMEWDRIFGDDPATVERDAGAFLTGLQANGVIGTLKHWPGIGSITQDPHLTLPTGTRSQAQLQSTDFATFKALLADDPGMIMVTHVLVPAYDQRLPATLSPTLVNGVLRGQMGYDGVVMTDSLYMKAISDSYTLSEAGVLSIIAGDDLLEGAFDSTSMAAMIAAIKRAMSAGRITAPRIDQSVRRILTLKARFGLLPLLPSAHGPQDAARMPTASGGGVADRPRPLLV